MKKAAFGCAGILLVLLGISIAAVHVSVRQIEKASQTMFQQFAVGAPVIPFSLEPAGRTHISFRHDDQKPCLTATAEHDRVTFSYEDRHEIVAPCTELSVHVFPSIPIPPRASFVVRYDPNGNVSKLETPHVWD
ncbi:hypothetical protein [Polyangium mundeleinium]|uniref:DUF3592 domain-containing protein n=1 Tax=Polyangium mundeleinium TaxID=2995306 RepID=A0ABT5EJH7_9BACT|nr:hypothetical protein [Polyangium mundeleinium]MDC0741624.1 hypothetical protein [Polyangium mundeleinium]